MKKRVLGLLGLMLLVAAGSFVWHGQRAPHAPTMAQSESVTPEVLSLAAESVDALSADNNELQARIEALRNQQADAEQLIALKTARLSSLEKSTQKP